MKSAFSLFSLEHIMLPKPDHCNHASRYIPYLRSITSHKHVQQYIN